ncbi:hypothetical protein K431DRAFT_297835 [Polychaeton citri CBS 116435]|uniref:Uncharacterized protein n=1 Tax=Polychaeton citri CBS 116435 TaxID=1314669 RepID=A0A9P4ULY7_9PEZI|nr:hypothetical protein K431DRAFT_297835 [Polychaeton citri CBS 116435]
MALFFLITLLSFMSFMHSVTAAAIPSSPTVVTSVSGSVTLYGVVYATPWITVTHQSAFPTPTDDVDYSTVTVRATHTIYSDPPISLETAPPSNVVLGGVAARQIIDVDRSNAINFSRLGALWSASLSVPPHSSSVSDPAIVVAGIEDDAPKAAWVTAPTRFPKLPMTLTTSITIDNLPTVTVTITKIKGGDDAYVTATEIASPPTTEVIKQPVPTAA